MKHANDECWNDGILVNVHRKCRLCGADILVSMANIFHKETWLCDLCMKRNPKSKEAME
jgi:hypothetical protein